MEPPLWRVQCTSFLYFSVCVFKQEIQKERVKFGSKFVEGTENKLRLMGEKSCCIQARMGIIITQGRTKKMRPNIRIGTSAPFGQNLGFRISVLNKKAMLSRFRQAAKMEQGAEVG